VVLAETDQAAADKFNDYRRYISREGALTLFSGWSGIDLSAFDPEETLDHVESNAIQSAVAAFTSDDPDRAWSIAQIAEYCAIGGDGPVIVGSAATVADALQRWVDETGVDGFNLSAVVNPETFTDIVDLLVPELQRRGVYKKEYHSGTLREKLFARGPLLEQSHYGAQFRPTHKP
jgi:alkanesulfonate monooxygenase SsuD/methylene tetrahydromethanopterin reductase-like flavin-dependent oxidoreductase (luciferase family)